MGQVLDHAQSIWLSTILSHRIATHLHAVGVASQPVEDALSQCRIGYLLVRRETGSCEVQNR